ncbi:hypothetical protein PsYK624_134040 [Phanerochaete sordida]|uniref:Transcription factor CBF/NF-Y/archaeal histone domain-containing protein n=1 Tax=Phanerochaete sordida TaxID=48140 RepID=A0A9P3GLH5_9APHY|nr:hypothetical protein PsYK624_134040 [Phanerochaete sordida]
MAMSATSMSIHNTPRVAHIDDEMDVDPEAEDDVETEAEEEVDQLDSDSTQDEAPAGNPKARQRRPVQRERVPGQTLIPMDRLETILDSEGVASHMSKEAMFAVAAATESFIKRLAETGYRFAHHEQRSTFNYRDLASSTMTFKEFEFLRDTMPTPISLTDALERRAAKEKELLEPAVSTAPSPIPGTTPLPTPLPSSTPDLPNPTATKQRKGRSTNGSMEANAHANSSHRSTPASDTVSRRQSTREPKPRRRHDAPSSDVEMLDDAPPAAKAQNGNTRSRGPRERSSRSRLAGDEDGSTGSRAHSRAANGQDSIGAMTNGSAVGGKSLRGADNFGAGHAHPGGTYLPPEYLSAHNGGSPDDRWSSSSSAHSHMSHGQYMGPGMPFGRNGLTENPGRTIYSQQRQPNR